jgi:hypothetical protein
MKKNRAKTRQMKNIEILAEHSTLGTAWNSLLHDVKRLPTHGRFVSVLREMYRGV